MNLIDRYVYAVKSKLPAGQREDIEKELRTLIDDLLSERLQGREASERDVEEVLQKLGEPQSFADKYREKKRYLIGPENYDNYIKILKIVISCTAFGISIATFIGLAMEPVNAAEAFARLMANVISACFSAFAWVTGIFAIFEFKGVNLNEEINKEKGGWKPKDLPEIPEKKSIIRPAEPIAGIIFGVFAIILFNYSPELLGVFVFDGGKLSSTVPVFNLDFIKSSILLFNIAFCLGILREIVKLLIGRYTIGLAAAATVLNFASLILTLTLITNPNLWNPDFVTALGSMPNVNFPSSFDIAGFFGSFGKLFVAVFVFAYVLDTGVTVFRAFKYRQ